MSKSNSILDSIRHTLGLFLGIICFCGCWSVFLVFLGNKVFNTCYAIILIYQYLFAKKSETYKKLIEYLEPTKYFNNPVKFIFEQEPITGKTVYCFHPHGIISMGAGFIFLSHPNLRNIVPLGSRVFLNMPISGLFAKWFGIQSVNAENLKKLMKEGKTILIIPGGFEESTICQNKQDSIYLKDRKGFVKYCLEYGYRAVPIYSFNENKIYWCSDKFLNFRLWLNKYKIPAVITMGKYFVFPNKSVNITIAFGKPVDFPQIEKPNKDNVDTQHEKYSEALISLFDKYSKEYGSGSKLIIR